MHLIKDYLQNEWLILTGAWLLLIVGLIIIGYTTANFEGVGSIGLLITAVLALWKLGAGSLFNKYEIIIFLLVWGFLGIIFDAAGNFIYNKPYEYFCPAETVLVRDAIQEEDHEGNTITRQYFSCYSMKQGKAIKELSLYLTIGIRFIQYILLGSILIGVYTVLSRFRK